MCNEIDPTLKYEQLPAYMVVKGFIKGEKDCNYEVYLREFLNASSFFMSLSNGQGYHAPDSESHGECDAISEDYSIDFKLMVASSRMEASSMLSYRITKFTDGGYCFGGSRVKSEMRYTNLSQALRYKDVGEIERIDNGTPLSLVEKDVKGFVKLLQTKKNLMLFLPLKFGYLNDRTVTEGISGIQQAISFDLKACIEYREKKVENFATYLATLYDGKVLFFQLSSNGVNLIDCINVEKSQTFMKLYDCGWH